jgi:hypothetical protein
VRQAAIAATTIVVAGVFLAVVAATGTSMTTAALGLVAIAVVASVLAVALSPSMRSGANGVSATFAR